MEHKFWLDRWEAQEIGFHQAESNPWLMRHWASLGVRESSSVFVPLCGKSLDMRWIEQRGHPVVGVELSGIAIDAYFFEGGETVAPETQGALVRYRGRGTTIYGGDFFELTAAELRGAEGVFDRGALVALPPEMRGRYADHLLRVVPDGSHILLVVLEYDQAIVSGPPFAVLRAEVESLYGERCSIERLDEATVERLPPHMIARGLTTAVEAAYHLVKRG